MIAHHANRPHGQQHSKGLPDFVVQTGIPDFIQINRIGQAQYVATFFGDFTGNADGKAGAGEGMATNKLVVKAQFAAQCADLVFEQFAQGLDQLHIHPRGQAADIVMAFDRHRWPAGERYGLNHIGIERALRKEIRTADFLGLFFKDIDEFTADKLALFLWVGHTRKASHKAFLGIDHDQRDVIMVAEQAFDLLTFVQTQQAMIDKYTGQLLANGFVDQDRGHR